MLQPRTRPPELKLPLLSGSTFDASSRSPESFTIIVFYRGKHCPICKTYLTEIEGSLDKVEEVGAELVAVSMDDESRARASAEEWGLSRVEIAYGMTEQMARDWGLYISSAREGSEEPAVFSEPGLVVLRPNGEVFMVEVQSAPFTRPPLDQLVRGLKFALDKDYPARGDLSAKAA